jgi:hypothetical protein
LGVARPLHIHLGDNDDVESHTPSSLTNVPSKGDGLVLHAPLGVISTIYQTNMTPTWEFAPLNAVNSRGSLNDERKLLQGQMDDMPRARERIIAINRQLFQGAIGGA